MASPSNDAGRRPGVLFLCIHNAGRSQMAAGYLRSMVEDRVNVFSGGSNPADQINASAVAAMAEEGIDIASSHPQPWTMEMLDRVDVVVTMGCGDVCPTLPAVAYQDWELDDPAGQPIEFVRTVRNEIKARVTALAAELLDENRS